METAQPLAKRLNLQVPVLSGLNELDFGDWTGRSVTDLNRLDSWTQWNQFRSGAQIPNGETMAQAQSRMVTEIERLRREFPGERIALFSHGDPIRTALLYYLGMPLDFVHRLEVSPASWTLLTVSDWSAQVLGLNLWV